ncbi:restriction endonuclease subunit S domain-containing protein [Rufibacter latericius]|uniref:Uncharacterized protein n=1 Tax=Rufibacter latericius TaxID=2487040 RepID=A0A3M9MBV0_9BACT|nr:hypothetical protein [Rufibacter latericius]RNI22655.1 hypothetical protein EFB08_21415 [Rufibacter latericius]
MEDQVREMVLKKLDGLRGEFPMPDLRLFEFIAKVEGLEKLEYVLNNPELLASISNFSSVIAPTYLLDFFNDLAEFIKPNSHLDPWVTFSSPIVYQKSDASTALCISTGEAALIRAISPEAGLNLIEGDPVVLLGKITSKFDLISCFSPFLGGQIDAQEILKASGLKKVSGVGEILLLMSANLLTDKGKGMFLLPPSFLFDKTVKENLERQGVFIEAVFTMVSGSYMPHTNIAPSLIVFSKVPTPKTFVAEISKDAETNKVILNHFKTKKDANAVQLGCWTDFKTFTSLQSLVSEKDLQSMIKRIGFPPFKLSDITLAINILKGDAPEEVVALENCIYLPRVGNSLVVTSPLSLKIKPKNCYQIQLDGSVANSAYVAKYFNSLIGKRLRESMEVGTSIRQIPKSALTGCTIYLPDVPTQLNLIELDNKIDQFSLRLDELKRDLWRQPNSYKNIQKELKGINNEEKLEHWIDNLPFPISSILWRYYATQDNGRKVEHLFHFFEALSEFLAMIMLSALVRDKEFYKKESHKWIDTNGKFKDWYLRATFGNWNNLTANLSKATRQYLTDKEGSKIIKKAFGNPSDGFLNMLTTKQVVVILTEVAGLRNQWKGHGGITSDEENKQRVLRLEQYLNELRKLIADGFDDVRMVSPRAGELENGLWSFQARELIGAKSPFREVEVKSFFGLDRKKLYLVHGEQPTPVELLPFIRYNEASNACYFYTSIQGSNVRWVSYHFDVNPELNEPLGNDLADALNLFK